MIDNYKAVNYSGRNSSKVLSVFFKVSFFIVTILANHSAFAQATLSNSLVPNIIGPGSVSTLNYVITNGTGSVVTGLSFTNNLPAVPGPLTIADPANLSTNCNAGASGTLTAPDGGTVITLSNYQIGVGQSCRISVDVTASIPGVHTNPAVTLISSSGSSMSSSVNLTVNAARPGFSKSFSPSLMPLGDRSVLTFTIDNTLNAARVGSLDFTDNFPVGMIVADPANASSDCVSPVINDTTITAVPGSTRVILDANGSVFSSGVETLPAGGTCTVNVDVTSTAVGRLVNVTGDLLGDFNAAGKASAVLEVTRTDLAIQQSFTNDPVAPGQTAFLEFKISNVTRSRSATGIAFTNDLSAVLSGLTVSSLESNDCGGTVTGTGGTTIGFTGGAIGPEGSCTIRVGLSVPAGATPGVYVNTSSAVTGMLDGSPVVGNMASDSLLAEPVPVLTVEFLEDVTLLPNPAVNSGDNVVIRYTVTNPSIGSTATDVEFLDELTDSGNGLGFLPFPLVLGTLPSAPCGIGSSISSVFIDIDRSGIQLSGGTLLGSTSCTFDVPVQIPADVAAGLKTNVTGKPAATIDGATREGTPASGSFTVIAAPILTKSFTGSPVAPGDTVTLEYTLSHSAESPTDATAITFTDDLTSVFAGLTANFPAAPDPQCGVGSTLIGSAGNTLLTFSGGTLSPGASCTFSLTLNVPAATTSATITSATSVVSATVNTLATSSPAAQADLTVTGFTFTKEFLSNTVIAGESTTLRFTMKNISLTDDATGIFFTDSLSAVLSGFVATGAPTINTCGGALSGTGFLIYVGGSLLAGEQCTIDVDVLVPAAAADGSYGSISNNLTATQGVVMVTADSASDTLTVNSSLVSLSKKFTTVPVVAGDTATLVYEVSNLDAARAASAISFSDNLGSVVTGLAVTSVEAASSCVANGAIISGLNTPTFSVTNLSLAPGVSCTITANLAVSSSVNSGQYTSTTSLISGVIAALPVGGPAVSDVLSVIKLDVDFTKAFGVSTLTAASSTSLEYTITNNDASSLSRLFFTDDLDVALSGLVATNLPLSDVCGPGSMISGTSKLTLINGNLPGNGACTFSVELSVPMSAVPNTYVSSSSGLTENSLSASEVASATLTIAPTPPLFNQAFVADKVRRGFTAKLQFTIDNSASVIAAASVNFTNSLPVGVVVAAPANISSTCTGGITTAAPGSSVITYSGGGVAALSSCVIAVDVLPLVAATFVSTAGDLTSSLGSSGAASATLQSKGAIFSKNFAAINPEAGGNTFLRFTINNLSASDALNDLSFSDNLNQLLPGIEVNNALPMNSVCGAGSILSNESGLSLTGGSIAAGGSCSFTVGLKVPANVASGAYLNTTSGLVSGSLLVADPARSTLTIAPTVNNDVDNDTILNAVDNCPNKANTDQADLDNDNIGNVCDNDSDNDLIPDDYEIANGLNPFNSLDQQSDPDGDGFSNLEEFKFGTDPNVFDLDENNNGVPDLTDLRKRRAVVPSILFPLLLGEI